MTNLKTLKTKLGVTTVELSSLLGVSPKQCEKWLYNHCQPTKATQELISMIEWLHDNHAPVIAAYRATKSKNSP